MFFEDSRLTLGRAVDKVRALMMKLTKSFSKAKATRKYYLVDLQGQTLGRAASKISKILRGKYKSTYTPHEDMGDFVVAINAEGVQLTGNKLRDKLYHHHSEFIGGIKEFSAERLLKRKPTELIYRAVKGMMPKTHLAKKQLKKLKIYAGAQHPHASQLPEVLDLTAKR